MKSIQILVDEIEEELCGAKDYAEKSISLRIEGNGFSQKFKDMATQELQHANILHEYAIEEIKKIREVLEPPEEMLEKWEKAHRHYIEKAAWIRQMLSI